MKSRGLNGKRKTNKDKTVDEQDHFSKLPEPLIVHILSMLEMKDAIKTGVLAKSWKNLWTQVHNIVLHWHVKTDEEDKLYADFLSKLNAIKKEEMYDENDDDGDLYAAHDHELSLFYEQQDEIRRIKHTRWISCVDSMLAQCITTYIHRFCLIGHWLKSDFIKDKWIQYALDRKVKIMELTLHGAAPDCLFQSSSITKMELYSAKLSPSTKVNLSSLKSFLLDDPTSDHVALEQLVMGCPVLENLVLDNVRDLHHLNVMSRSVKKLKLRWFEYFESEIDFLNIKAPWIQELEISETFFTDHCHLVDVSSLTKATLTFHPIFAPENIFEIMEEDQGLSNGRKEYSCRWIRMASELLYSLAFVGELVIGSEPIQTLLVSKLLGTPSPSFMCKHLSVETHIWKFDLPGIAWLLENAPHLETLFIKVVPFSCDPKDVFPLFQTQILFHNRDPHLNMPNGKFSHLRNVKIEYCQRSCHDYHIKDNHGGFFDFELVEYILKSAVVLEKLVVCSSRGWSCSDSTCLVPNCSFQYVPDMCSKLIINFRSATGNEADGWEFQKSTNKLEFTFTNYASLFYTADSSSSST